MLPVSEARETPRDRGPVSRRVVLRDARVWLAAYIVALMLIGFWPTHVDRGAGPFLRWITQHVPLLTYDRVQSGANVVLFVPLGVLLMLIMHRRYLIMPIALLATMTIEGGQSFMHGARTPSLGDVITNVTGAAVGMLIVAAIDGWRARAARRATG